MKNRNRCRYCQSLLMTPHDKFCSVCGAPQKKERGAVAKFFAALLKCAGYFAIYFGITLLFEGIHEATVMFRSDSIPNLLDDMELSEFLVKLSEHFCEVGIITAAAVLVTYWLIFVIRKKKVSDEVRLKAVSMRSIAGFVLLGLSAQFAVSLGLTLFYILVPSAAENSASGIYELIFERANPVTEFLYVAVVTPLLEETLFRGLIYTRLRRALPRVAAIILSAAIFGAAHGNIEQFIYAGLLGCLMAAAFEKYDSLWASYAIHFSFNAGSFLLVAIPENAGIMCILLPAAIGIFLVAAAFLFFTKTVEVQE